MVFGRKILTLCLLFASMGLIASSLVENYLKPVSHNAEMRTIPGVDYIYMINLDERPEKFQTSLNFLRPFGIVPCRFSAVNGWKLPFQALDDLGVIYEMGMEEGPLCTVFRHEEGREYMSFEIMKDPHVSYYCHSFTRGAVGCILSHLSVLQDAIESQFQTIWVMEDDIQTVSDPLKLSTLIAELGSIDPEWDVLFTDDEIKGAQGVRIYCRGILPRPLLEQKPFDYYLPRIEIHPEMIRLGMRYGSHSMIVNRPGILKIFDFFKKYKLFFPYDLDYCFVPNIRMYACKYDIVTNRVGGPSDLGTPSYEKQLNN